MSFRPTLAPGLGRYGVPRYLATPQPFPIRAVQVDGGNEFAAEFEQACQQRGLHLFVLPPRSIAVERANRTHTEEFYQVTPCSLEMKKLNPTPFYNTLRHQSLGYLTPHQFLLPLILIVLKVATD